MGTYLIQSCEVCGALLHAKDASLHAEWHRKMPTAPPTWQWGTWEPAPSMSPE